MHLRIALLRLVLGRARSVDDRRIHDRARLTSEAAYPPATRIPRRRSPRSTGALPEARIGSMSPLKAREAPASRIGGRDSSARPGHGEGPAKEGSERPQKAGDRNHRLAEQMARFRQIMRDRRNCPLARQVRWWLLVEPIKCVPVCRAGQRETLDRWHARNARPSSNPEPTGSRYPKARESSCHRQGTRPRLSPHRRRLWHLAGPRPGWCEVPLPQFGPGR